MSFLVGTTSGALVAGGVYYGFSAMMAARTQRHRSDMHHLSDRLGNAAADIHAPIPAAQRIPQRPFLSMLQDKWNAQVAALFSGTRELDQRIVEWGRKGLYGRDNTGTNPE